MTTTKTSDGTTNISYFCCILPKSVVIYFHIIPLRGISAAGSAPHWQCGGQGFEPPMLHQMKRDGFYVVSFHFLFYITGARTREGASVGENIRWIFEQRAVRWRSVDRRGGSTQAKRCGRSSPLCSTKQNETVF